MSIATRRINTELCVKTQKYLQKVAKFDKQNMYFYNLQITESGKDEGLALDALLRIDTNSLTVLKIWELVYDSKKGMAVARNTSGEKGVRAKILAEKYFNNFFDYLETIDIDTCTDKQIMITPELVAKMEAEIDERLRDLSITDFYIEEYEAPELIEFSLASLRECLNRLDLLNHYVLYDDKISSFEINISLDIHNVKKFVIPMIDVIKEKQATKQSIFNAAVNCLRDAMISEGLVDE